MPECQFRVSRCFWFQKSYTENIVEIGGIFSSVNKRLGSFQSLKTTWGGAPRGPHAMGARPGVAPRPARVWWPWLAPDAHPSPIYPPRRKNHNTRDHIPRKVLSRPSSSISDRGSSDVLPAPCRRGNHHRGLLHHHACLRSYA